jgi:hypothetical protein
LDAGLLEVLMRSRRVGICLIRTVRVACDLAAAGKPAPACRGLPKHLQ